MLIVLIDDGIDTAVYPDIRIKYDLSVGADGVIRNRDVNDSILTNHGATWAPSTPPMRNSAIYESFIWRHFVLLAVNLLRQ